MNLGEVPRSLSVSRNGGRVRRVSRVLSFMTRVNAGGTGAPQEFSARSIAWNCPSAKLRVFFSCGFERDVHAWSTNPFGTDKNDLENPLTMTQDTSTWSLVRYARNVATGKRGDAEQVFVARHLGQNGSFEASSVVAEYRADFAFSAPFTPQAVGNGTWWAQCEWEPTVPVPADELDGLFNVCNLWLVDTLALLYQGNYPAGPVAQYFAGDGS